MQAKIVPRGCQATSGAWVALTPDLQLIQSPPEMVLEQTEIELDPEKASHGGAYQTEALLRWSEFHHRQYRRRLAAQHLDQHAIGVIGGYQLQAGASAQEFGSFLKTLEAAGQDTRSLWARLVRMFYDKVVVAGNLCSIGVLAWILGQLTYNSSKILDALKGQAFQLGIATILRAFCCGIVAFILKAKYEGAMMASTMGGGRRIPRRDEEEPMDVDPDPEEVPRSSHPQPKVSEAASILRNPGGIANEGEAQSRF